MSEEMQVKAKEIGSTSFQVFCVDSHWKFRGEHDELADCYTYRLRPDYEEKPETVECEISEHTIPYPNLVFRYLNDWWEISKACNFPDFIGFKYEDGIIRALPRAYQLPTYVNWQFGTSDEYEVLTPTHVLFKGKK
jgi:hypothetical protein